MKNHELEYEQNVYVGGYVGSCSCSDPDWEDSWSGHVTFSGYTEQEITDQHFDHLLEEGVL